MKLCDVCAQRQSTRYCYSCHKTVPKTSKYLVDLFGGEQWLHWCHKKCAIVKAKESKTYRLATKKERESND